MAIEIRLRELVTSWNSIASELAVDCFEATESIHALKAAEYYSLHIMLREHIALEQQVISQSRALCRHGKGILRLKKMQSACTNCSACLITTRYVTA